MSKKGIIVDVGFTADIKDFINTVEREFKSVDFSNMIGLSDAFNDQAKDVRSQLTKLKDEIDSVLNGTVKNDPVKQIQNLNKSVGILTSSFKEMIKTMPSSQADKLMPGLDGIIADMNQMSDVCDNAVGAIEGVKKAADGDIQLVNADKLKELEELYKVFINLERQVEKAGTARKKSGNISYKDSDEVLRDIIASYEKYCEVLNKIEDVEDSSHLSDSEKTKRLDELNNEYIQMSVNLQRLIATYEKLEGNLGETIKIGGGKSSISGLREDLEDEFDGLLSYISKRKAEIQSEVYSIGGGNLDSLVEDTNQALKSNKLTVPISISKKESTLLKDALALIDGVQSKIDGNPLQVEVAFVSQYKTKRNKELLEQISGSLDNISDDEIKSKLSNLVDNLNKQLGDDLLIKVKLQGSNEASDAVKELINSLQSQFDEADFTVYPEIKMADEVKQKLQSDIDELSKNVQVNIGFIDEAGEATGSSSVKKEIKNISDLHQNLESVITAIENKTIAFQVEEQTVEGVISREITSLAELIGWLNTVENSVKELSTYFESLAPNFKINFTFSDDSVESINSPVDDNTLSKLSNIKQLIFSSISSEFGELIEIPESQKKKLLKDVQNLSTQINNIFETKSIDAWSSKFLSSLTEISNKIKTLFGNNALSDMIEEWNYSDNLMNSIRGENHLRERAAVIDDKGNIYGSGTYDQPGSTRFLNDIINKMKIEGVSPKIGIHSHGSDRIVASSLVESNNSGDIIANYFQYIRDKIEKQLTIALEDIELFDAKGFFDSNSKIDFNDKNIINLIKNKANEMKLEIQDGWTKYFKDFIERYGSGNGLNLKDVLFDYIADDGDPINGELDELGKQLKDAIDPQKLLSNFFDNTKIFGSLEEALSFAFNESFNMNDIDYKKMGLDKYLVNQCIGEYIRSIITHTKEILDSTFDISKFDYMDNGRDIWTFNYRQITPKILEEALNGTEYKNNYQDFMKVYSKEDFIKENPLDLSSSIFSDLFNNAAPTSFLETLDKIVSNLQEIKNFSSGDTIANAFAIKIDENSLKSFIDEINKLIESLEKLPAQLTETFSGFSNIKSGEQVGSIDTVDGEIQKLGELEQKLKQVTDAVNEKTDAFKEEGDVVGAVIDGEIQSFDPLRSLESTYNDFKKFYDNDDLESEAGAQAALSYYNAYKEALEAKLNKKDLQQYTIGSTDNLFTGNYTNYKKGVGELDLSGLTSQITKYQEIVDEFNQPEVINIINSLTEAIEKLLNAGNNSAEATALLKNLNSVINNLGGKNSAEKIERVATNLENFQKSVQQLDISDSGFVQSLSSILEKGEELKALGEVLKSTKKQMDAVDKAVKAEDNLKQSQKYLEQYESNIKELVNQKYENDGSTVLYQNLEATKDGVVKVTALIKDAKGEYQKYVLTTTDGSDLVVKASNNNAAAIAKEVKQWELYQRQVANVVPGANNLGKDGITFLPGSDGWDDLKNKIKETGIEIEKVIKIVRTRDRDGAESFQVFTDLSRITVGMDSKDVLYQIDRVLDKGSIEKFKKEIETLQNLLSKSFKGTDLNTADFLDSLDKISDKWRELNDLKAIDPEIVSDNEMQKLQEYFEIFKKTIEDISLNNIDTTNKTDQFVEQLHQAADQLEVVKNVLDKVKIGEAFTDNDINQIKQFITQMRTLYAVEGDKENKIGNDKTISKTLIKIYKTLDQNSAMANELKQRYRELAEEIESFGYKIPADKVDEFTSRFEKLNTELYKSGKTGKSTFDSIIDRAKSMSKSFISMYLSLYDVVRYIKSGVSVVQELDTALTEMRKVSDESVESLKNFQEVSFDIASSVGTTAQQIQNSTADWMGEILVPLYGNI